MSPINVLSVDDNPIQTSGLSRLFERCEDINYRGNVTSPEACLERLKDDKMVDIILMDVHFPRSNINGIDFAYQLRELYPFVKENEKRKPFRIVFFSVEDLGIVDLDQGIHGLIPKREDFNQIVERIIAVYRFGAPMEDHAKEESELPTFWLSFSFMEKKVFCMVIKPMSTREIAFEENLSPLTITTHRRNILTKIKEHLDQSISRIDDPRIVEIVIRYNLCSLMPQR